MYNLLLYKTFVLRSLVLMLEDEGIVITTAAAIEMEKVLANTDIEELQNLSELKYMVAPLLCRNKEDQDKIYKVFGKLDAKLIQEYTIPDEAGKNARGQIASVDKKAPEKGITRSRYLKKVILWAGTIVALSALIYLIIPTPPPPPPPAPEKKIQIFVSPATAIVNDTIMFTGVIDSSLANQNTSIDWKFPDSVVSDQSTVFKIVKDTSIINAIAFLKDSNGVHIASDSLSIQALCEPPPSVAIDESDIAANGLKTANSNKKQFGPLFTNPAADTHRYKYNWFVDDSLYSHEKVLKYSKPYRSIKLVVDSKGIHCSTDSMVAQVESIPALNVAISGDGKLTIVSFINWKNILISLLLLVLVPVIISSVIYRILFSLKNRLPAAEESEPGTEGPYKIAFTPQQNNINTEEGIRKLADVLRKRQVSDVYKLNIRKTIRSTVALAGIPKLEFVPLSKPVSFLVFIDRDKPDSLLVKLFEFLAAKLQDEEVDISIYSYSKEPLLLSNEKFNQEGIPIEKIAALYPDTVLFIFGEAQYFLYPAERNRQALGE